MFDKHLVIAGLGGVVALSACTSGQVGVEPPITTANVAQSQLQFQVGTANIAGSAGLNTVVTFRQANGLSAVLVSTPTITLPFTNTAAASVAGADSGTNVISGTPQQPAGAVIAANQVTTFGQPVGAFSYGFLASNATQTGANNSTFYSTALTPASGVNGFGNASGANTMPYYAPAANRNAFYVGPPFVPNFKDGSLGTAFFGAPSGFTPFQLTPTTGSYVLNLLVPGNNFATPSFTATTQLTSTALLPTMPTPVFTSTAPGPPNTTVGGGGTVTVVVPPGVRETMIEARDVTLGTFYTIVVQGSGTQTVAFPANLGTVTNGVAGFTFNKGDTVRVIAVGFDYPAMEAVEFGPPPFPQAPPINNIGSPCTFSGTSSVCPGQANLTMSAPGNFTE